MQKGCCSMFPTLPVQTEQTRANGIKRQGEHSQQKILRTTTMGSCSPPLLTSFASLPTHDRDRPTAETRQILMHDRDHGYIERCSFCICGSFLHLRAKFAENSLTLSAAQISLSLSLHRSVRNSLLVCETFRFRWGMMNKSSTNGRFSSGLRMTFVDVSFTDHQKSARKLRWQRLR